MQNPEPWRAIVLRDLRVGPTSDYWRVALIEARWLAKRIGPADVQAAAHTDELVEQRERPF